MTDHTIELVRERVQDLYWQRKLNCATATLIVLSEDQQLPLSDQVLDAAVGMHGAGRFGAQCGLVEGGLMFIGLAGRRAGLSDQAIGDLCRAYAAEFQRRFGSLQCSVLRPQGFHPDNPPHLCEDLTINAITFDIEFARQHFNGHAHDE